MFFVANPTSQLNRVPILKIKLIFQYPIHLAMVLLVWFDLLDCLLQPIVFDVIALLI